MSVNVIYQGRSEGTSTVAINSQIYFINLLIFKLFDDKFLFSENHVFRKEKRMAVYGLMDARP